MSEQSLGRIDSRPRGPRLGPHRVPKIVCGNCGTPHHYDAAAGEHQGRCVECSAFLRNPTVEEHELFGDFLAWNSNHMDRELQRGESA